MTVLEAQKLLAHAPDEATIEFIEQEKASAKPYLLINQTKKVDLNEAGNPSVCESISVRLYG